MTMTTPLTVEAVSWTARAQLSCALVSGARAWPTSPPEQAFHVRRFTTTSPARRMFFGPSSTSFTPKVLNEAAEALEKSQTLEAALTGLLEAKFGRTLAVITESPHGMELVDATNRLTGPATRAADDAFQALVVKALVRHGRVQEVDAVADTLIAAAKGLMRSGEVHVPKAKFKAANPPTGRLADRLTN